MLEGRAKGKPNPEGLTFTSPTGRPIDDHNFSQRIWKRLCAKAVIPYRRPYNARHSVASHAINQGATLPQVAYILGHGNTRMVSQTYGHNDRSPPASPVLSVRDLPVITPPITPNRTQVQPY